jgi:hypothetical protein
VFIIHQVSPNEATRALTIKHLVCESSMAICIIDFTAGGEIMMGIYVFEVSEGLITRVTDYLPESYEPPHRQTPFLKRRPAA